LEKLSLCKRIRLKLDLSVSEQGKAAWFSENVNEYSGFVKYTEFPD
jgi:hypothetical protein